MKENEITRKIGGTMHLKTANSGSPIQSPGPYAGEAQQKNVENDGAESAGINRQEAEDENSSRERSSDPLGPEFCAVGREALP